MDQTRKGVGVGRVLSLEKGTDCGQTAAELWLLRVNIARKRRKKGGWICLVIINSQRELSI